ncbi:MAG: hypothetical protein ACT4O2_09205 [Beijerinckiaceae bacterium]
MKFDAQRIYDLLPAIYRIRDTETAGADTEQGGPLQQLIAVIAEQAAVLEENLAQLYDDQFIETCADWVTPYLGGLIGYRSLHGVAPRISSPRADVANTIAYRRRKGTAAMLEQLARDVTDWDARVVEFFDLLITTQYMSHIRPHNKASPDLRAWEPLERLGTAFNSIAHTVDVRRIATRQGKFNIPNIGVFLWRLHAYPLTGSPAFQVDQNRYLFSPLGNNTPLFTRPEAEEVITHIAKPINVPARITRRVLDRYMRDYYGVDQSLWLRFVDAEGILQEIGAEEIHACNLSDEGRRQRIRISGLSNQTYTLTFAGETTAPINSDASLADIQAALESLPSIAVGDISVEGEVAASEVDVTVSFSDAFTPSPVPPISVSVQEEGATEDVTTRVDSNWAHETRLQIGIDPELGRLWFPSNIRQRMGISGHRSGSYRLSFGGQTTDLIASNARVADIRAALVDLDNLSAEDISVIGEVASNDIRIVIGFAAALGANIPLIGVDADELTPTPTVTVTELLRSGEEGPDLRVDFHYGFGAALGGGEYERQQSFTQGIEDVARVVTGESIQAALDSIAQDGAVEINDSGRYEESLSITVPAAGHLEIRAGNGHRPTVVLSEALQLRGGSDSELTLNGLVLASAGVTIPATDNGLRQVTLRHCTLVPGLELAINGEPLHPNAPSLIVEHESVTLVIDHCIIGAVRTTPVTKVAVNDSIIDATDPALIAFASVADAENEPGGELTIENSTVIGRVFATSLPLVSNTIFHASAPGVAPVRSVRKQIGCVRFSYLPRGSQVPRRYRCQPDLAIQKAIDVAENKQAGALTDAQRESITNGVYARIQPAFTSLRYGSPAYCQLRQLTPIEIRTGADDESEMGVFHQVHQPQRETNLHVRFDEYLRFGLEAGIFYET